MIIGYGFRDGHINEMLIQAARLSTKFFIIDYNGTDAIRPDKAAISQEDYELLRSNVIGASRRPSAKYSATPVRVSSESSTNFSATRFCIESRDRSN